MRVHDVPGAPRCRGPSRRSSCLMAEGHLTQRRHPERAYLVHGDDAGLVTQELVCARARSSLRASGLARERRRRGIRRTRPQAPRRTSTSARSAERHRERRRCSSRSRRIVVVRDVGKLDAAASNELIAGYLADPLRDDGARALGPARQERQRHAAEGRWRRRREGCLTVTPAERRARAPAVVLGAPRVGAALRLDAAAERSSSSTTSASDLAPPRWNRLAALTSAYGPRRPPLRRGGLSPSSAKRR